MTEAERLAEIVRRLPQTKSGTLRFWGIWFGKPYDNHHRITGSEAERDFVQFRFDANERLSVWSPEDFEAGEAMFRIARAARVRWEWYYYGRPQTDENFCFMDFIVTPAGFDVRQGPLLAEPNLQPDATEAAVEML